MTDATVRPLLAAAAARLRAAGIASPELDAALLLAAVLGVRRHQLALGPDAPVDADAVARYDTLLARRVRREPISHVLGRAEFWSLEFEVTADTLAPRPETEGLVERALRELRALEAPVVVDVGTGTGCIAVVLARELPAATVHAVDIHAETLEVARRNAVRHGVAARVRLHLGDLLAPLAGHVAPGSVDAVLSNPPYVRHDEVGDVDPEVLHEPRRAVFVDGEPAALYARIATEALPYLRAGGLLACELPGDEPAPITAAVGAVRGYAIEAVLPDLAGHPRVLVARRAP